MTDMQVRHQANALKEKELAIDEAKLAETQRSNLAKEAETHRTNVMKETLQDLENQSKYGYDKYMPLSEEGDYRRTSAWGSTNTPFDFIKHKIVDLFPGISLKL